MAAPMSSGTMWITENAGQPVVHVALQGIGHTSDEEGKAALAAAVAVAAGGDPAALFGDLAAKYPSSPRLAAYQARAGTTGTGVLAASGVAAMMLSGVAFWGSSVVVPVATPEELAAAELAAAATAKAAEEQAAAELAAAAAAKAAEEAQAAADAAKASGDAAAKKAAEEAKKAADAEKKKADAAAKKKKAEAEAKAKAEADAKAKADADAKKRAEEEEEAKKKADAKLKVGPIRLGRPK